MNSRQLPEYLKERIKNLPESSGVYLFKDAEGHPVYIGKANSIKKRVSSHFRFYGEGFSKEGVLLSRVKSIDYVMTPSEAEALLLEASLVRAQMPRYNAMLKDDKSYPFLKITDEEFPRLLIVRGRKADGGRYFGPYTSARLLRQAVRMLRRVFPLRTCEPIPKKVCLMYHIGQCKGPCVGEIGKDAYQAIVKDLEHFLEGRRDALVRSLTRRMKEHSAKKEFEKAQAMYEEIKALSSVPWPRKKEEPSQALVALKDSLGLPAVPARIEGFDISNISGKEAVGSMVVFVSGKPCKSDYRRFRIRTVAGIDDYRMMQEMVRRRYSRVLAEDQAMPDLVVIDGGKGHLSAAKKELDALGLEKLPVISIAKQHEHIFVPEKQTPFIFSPTSPHLALVRRLRDEAHRFAISYHRRLHRKEVMISLLDEIPGVGPKTREKLLKRFGSVERIKRLTEEALAGAGVSPRLSKEILGVLNRPPAVQKRISSV